MAYVVTDGLSWWTRARPDATAVVVGREAVTYRELAGWTDRVAYDLIATHGVRPGDVVAVAGVNSLDWCIAALGAVKAGAILTPFNYRYTAEELAPLVVDSAPGVVFTDATQAGKLQQVAEAGHDLRLVPLDSVRALRGGDAVTVDVEISPDDPVVLAYTSGTTGRPKGLVYTHASVLAALFELVLKDPTPPEETTMLLTLPLFSVAGIMHNLLHMTSRGAKCVIMEDFDPALALELLVEHRVSHMNGVPVIYERISQVPGFDTRDLSHIKVAMVGGARVSESLLSAWHARGVALRHMYGMTEVGGCGTVPRPDDALARPDLCGDGSIFTEFKTVDGEGVPCAPGEIGEILMRGPAMMARYWNNEEATRTTIVDGWIHSGDLGTVDENGYLLYVDRLKDMIISGGFNVSPTEVENVIGAIPGVLEVAVVAVQDKQWGETPAAIIYADRPLDADVVVKEAREHLAVFKVPRYVVQVDEPLPRMSSGKLDKRHLKAQFADIPLKQSSVS